MSHSIAEKQLRAGSMFLFAALAVSLVGFLGYYTQNGFISLPPTAVIFLQLSFLLAGTYSLRTYVVAKIGYLWPLLAFSAWAFATSIIADDITALRRTAIILAPGILISLLATMDPDPHRTFIRFTRLLIIVSILSTIFSLLLTWLGHRSLVAGEYVLQLWNAPEAPGMQIGWRTILALVVNLQRPSGLTSNANSFGIIASLALICGVIRCMVNQRFTGGDRARAILLLLIVASTASRGAIFFSAIAVVFLAIHKAGKLKWLGIPALALIVATPIAFSILITSGLIDAATPSPSYAEESFAFLYEALHLRERATIWLHAYERIDDYWLLGAGFSLIQEKVFSPLGMQTSAHSVPLSILIETGVIGLVLMLITWFLPVVRAFLSPRIPPLAAGIAAILIALYGHQVFDSSIFRYHFLHFIFCYFLGAISNPTLSGDSRNSYAA